MNKKYGFIALLVAAITFSTFGVLIRQLSVMFSQYGQVAIRSSIAVIIVAFLIYIRKLSLKIDVKDRIKLILFCLAFPLSIVLFTLSVTSIKASNSVFMLYVGSLATSFIIGSFIFKEKVTGVKLIASIITIVGLIVFVYPFNFEAGILGLVWGLGSGILDGISNSLRKSLGKYNRQTLLFYQYLTGIFIALALATTQAEVLIKETNIASILVAILFGFGLVFIGNLLIYGFNNFDVNAGTIILATELFFSLIINAIFLQEYPTLFELLGGTIIFFAFILLNTEFDKLVSFRKKYLVKK